MTGHTEQNLGLGLLMDKRRHVPPHSRPSILTVVAVVAFVGCGNQEIYRSPAEVFDARWASQDSEDWNGFLDTMTPDSQQIVTGNLLRSMLYWAASDEDTKTLLVRHRIDSENWDLSSFPDVGDLMANPEIRQRHAKTLASSIENHRAFFRECKEHIKRKAAIGDLSANSLLDTTTSADVSLGEVTIDGDIATADADFVIEDTSIKVPQRFKRIGQSWYIDLVEP